METNKTLNFQNKHQRFPLFYLEMFLFTYKIQTRCDKPFMISSLPNQFLKLHPYSKHASRGWKWILSQST